MELVCPQCLAVNRVPEARLAEHPKCGKCGEQVLTGGVKFAVQCKEKLLCVSCEYLLYCFALHF